MDRIAVPFWATIGDSGNQLADTFDMAANLRFPSWNTYYAPNASVRFNKSGGSSKRKTSAKNDDPLNPFDNSGLFDDSPDTRALSLARDGTSKRWACNSASPFEAPFAAIYRQRYIEREYFKAGCTAGTIVILIFFILLHVGVMLAGVNYYIAHMPNPCAAIITGAMLQWGHGLLEPQVSLALPSPPTPNTPLPILQRIVRPPSSPPIVAGPRPAVIVPPPNGFASFWNRVFSPVADAVLPIMIGAQMVEINPTDSMAASKYMALCSLEQGSMPCQEQWSVPSREWVMQDMSTIPNLMNLRFKGCRPYCAQYDRSSLGGVCTCNKFDTRTLLE